MFFLFLQEMVLLSKPAISYSNKAFLNNFLVKMQKDKAIISNNNLLKIFTPLFEKHLLEVVVLIDNSFKVLTFYIYGCLKHLNNYNLTIIRIVDHL